ncbi:MAG: HDOD domain-containing protein [Desulfobacterales bacterium]|nr:HDOD domain-containing protein [Desulfobacterales bacterium]
MLNFWRKKNNDPKKELKGLLGNYELHSFPAVTTRVLAMLRNPESSVLEIAGQIQMDPGMHVKILRLVNSVSFGLLKEVGNLDHAVTLLGRARLESMVLSFAVTESLASSTTFCLDTSRFWLVAARRAGLARMLALHLHAATQGECFTAALLQDMAIPVLSTAKKETYCQLFQRWDEDPGLDLASLERAALGYDHARVGALIAEKWGLPGYLVNAIDGHHGPTDSSRIDPAVRLVAHLRYNDENDGTEKLLAACREEFQMETGLVGNMIDASFAEAEKIALIFR